MLYAVIAEDVPDSGSQRAAARPRHLARLEALKTEGRLILAGPHPAVDSPDPGPAGRSRPSDPRAARSMAWTAR